MAKTDSAPSAQATAPEGLNADQFRTVLGAIAGQADTLCNMLMIAQEGNSAGWEQAASLDAALIIARSIGAMADTANGCNIIGNADRWNYGPNFAKKGNGASHG